MSIFAPQLLPDLDLDDDGRTGDAPAASFIDLIGVPAIILFGVGIVFNHRTATIVGILWGLFNALSATRSAKVLADPFGEGELSYVVQPYRSRRTDQF